MLDNADRKPAYGMLAFSRVSGGDTHLFGSSVEHKQKIMLVLKTGHVTRELNNDWYGGDKTLFEVEMSYTQFAELISAMNVGDGVPVTIRYIDGQGYVEAIKTVNKRTQFIEEFKEQNDKSAATAKELLSEVEGIFKEKRAIKASERDEILSKLTQLYNAVNSHNSYMLNQFNEAMEGVSTEAKGEVEAFVQNKLNSIALAALRAKNGDTLDAAESIVKLEDYSSGSKDVQGDEG